MSSQIEIKTDKDKISGYINKFEKGLLQVPAFQRDFVWENEDKINLFDSIKRNYPVGSILLWQPEFDSQEEYDDFSGDELGGYNIPPRKFNSLYILDGYQRLSTLIGCLLHPQKAIEKGIIRNEKEWFKKFNIVYNLEDEFFEVNRSQNFDNLKSYQIPIYKLVDGKEYFNFQRSLFQENDIENEKFLVRYEEVSLIFQNYEIPNINLYGGTISEAIEIFQRLNSKGAPITTDWVVNASLFKKDKSFRFGSEIDSLLEELDYFNFKNLKRDVILNSITNSFGGVYFDQFSKNNKKRLESLVSGDDFIPVAKKTFEAIRTTVQFLYEELAMLDVKLLPYNNQLIFITDFFNNNPSPTFSHLQKLKKWFWITSYSNYFTIYNLSKQRLAYNQFQDFIFDENVDPVFYDGNKKFETQKFPEKKISMGSVRSKTLALFMLNYNLNQSNILQIKNNPINSDRVRGYKAFKLLIDRDNMVPENTLFDFVIYDGSSDSFSPKLKDLEFLLSNQFLGREENLFITNEMRSLYNENRMVELLKVRKDLIIEEEKHFVESLGIQYYFDFDTFSY